MPNTPHTDTLLKGTHTVGVARRRVRVRYVSESTIGFELVSNERFETLVCCASNDMNDPLASFVFGFLSQDILVSMHVSFSIYLLVWVFGCIGCIQFKERGFGDQARGMERYVCRVVLGH